MDGLNSALVWIAGAGGVGGGLNALVTEDLRLWPSRVAPGTGLGLFRPGIAINVAAGAGVSAGTCLAFAGVAGAGASPADGGVLLAVIVGLLLGWLGARSITDEADKRLLRAAACKAAAAPAADPATIRVMELARPSVVLKTATALEPRRANLR